MKHKGGEVATLTDRSEKKAVTMTSTYLSLFFTVALLSTTTYFMLGGLPLLILDHDTPLDGRFIRRFFEVYYSAAFIAAVGATISYALWGRELFALGAAAIAAGSRLFKRIIIPALEDLDAQIQSSAPGAISNFRKVHAAALMVNLIQLFILVWGVIHISV